MISRRRNGPFGRTRVTPSAFLIGPATAGTSILIGSLERTSRIGGGRGGGTRMKKCLAPRGGAGILIGLGPRGGAPPGGALCFSSRIDPRKDILSRSGRPNTYH